MEINDRVLIYISGLQKWPATTILTSKYFDKFYVAEVDHQDYFRLNPGVPYCAFLIAPKLKELENKKVIPEK